MTNPADDGLWGFSAGAIFHLPGAAGVGIESLHALLQRILRTASTNPKLNRWDLCSET